MLEIKKMIESTPNPSYIIKIEFTGYSLTVGIFELSITLTLILFLIKEVVVRSNKRILNYTAEYNFKLKDVLNIKTIEIRELCGADRCLVVFFHNKNRLSIISEAVRTGTTSLYRDIQNKKLDEIALASDYLLYTEDISTNEVTILTTRSKYISTKHKSFLRSFGVTFSANILLKNENDTKPFGILTMQYCSGYTPDDYKNYSDSVTKKKLVLELNSSEIHYKISEILAAVHEYRSKNWLLYNKNKNKDGNNTTITS